MKTWQKVGIGVGAAAVLGGIVLFSVKQANKGVVTVQTAKIAPQETLVSQVTASGEIKPTTYTNVTAQGFGRITEILIKEGDHVKKGDRLLLQENIQASADVQAQAASINSAESGVAAAEASYRAAQADLLMQQANLEKAKLDWERGQGLFKDGLIAKQDFDQRKTGYDAAVAQVDSSRARVLSSKATLDQMGSQVADVTIDAVPGKVFKGKVTEIGSQAVLRTSGLATTQSTASNQEAKDFKVVVTLANPPENVRPGLSTTAKIKTAEKKNVLAIPIQALAVRTRKDLEEAAKNAKKDSSVTLAAPPAPAPGDPKKDEIQGVFVVNGKKAIFRPVETGISGVTDIEITKGLQKGDEIVVGSYKALRTLKPESNVKIDNSAPKKPEENQS